MAVKRIVAALLTLGILLSLVGCKKTAQAPQTTTLPGETDTPQILGQKRQITLMVYMVGSDLEAKSGAGTADLEEMAASGVDLQNAHVVVCTGGSKKWHNDTVSQEERGVQTLTGEGFVKTHTMDQRSMGDPESLTEFLCYAYENYPAEDYALILWNHGNGPLIGYGKDMLFDNDSMTLSEMEAAMSASPFGPENKLAWVGFDACLMASAELSCVWDDYADYLLASQEVEPNFGWDYSFLKELTGSRDALLERIPQCYLAACQAYFEKKGYEGREATLSCMDLSRGPELEQAINDLFRAAAQDVDSGYESLAVTRVGSRALGRASTGSEYDLVDLHDLAQQMSLLYPTEAGALQKVVADMVRANANNTSGCCGMSLYYPFYNKSYYQKSWGQVYGELGVLSDYAAYLEQYTQQWLGSDLLDKVASSHIPQAGEQDRYLLEMTPEQAAAYADGRYYILRKDGEGVYTKLSSSAAVTREGNQLVADFDGSVLFVKNKFEQYCLPLTVQYDDLEDQVRYGVRVLLCNDEDYLECRFHLSANYDTKQVTTAALLPYDSQQTLVGGKAEEVDLSQFTHYEFWTEQQRYLARYEDGTVKPLNQWVEHGWVTGQVFYLEDEVEFVFAPLAREEYVLIFEIDDIQGNSYCSEPLPIRLTDSAEPEPERTPIRTNWTGGEKHLLLSEQDVSVWLTTIEDYDGIRYGLQVENRSDQEVTVRGNSMVINGTVDTEGSASITVPAGQTLTDAYGIHFGDAETCGIVEQIQSIHMNLQMHTPRKTLIQSQPVTVELSAGAPKMELDPVYLRAEQFHKPFLGILAQEQVLLEEQGLRITLMGIGCGGEAFSSSAHGYLRLENFSGSQRTIHLQGMSFDGVFVEMYGQYQVDAGRVLYGSFYINTDDLNLANIRSPETAEIYLYEGNQFGWVTGDGISGWYPVALTEQPASLVFQEGDTLLYEGNGLRLKLREVQDAYGDIRWVCTLVNTSGTDVSLQFPKVIMDGERQNCYIFSKPKCPDGAATAFEIQLYPENLGLTLEDDFAITLDMEVWSMHDDAYLWKLDQAFSLVWENT